MSADPAHGPWVILRCPNGSFVNAVVPLEGESTDRGEIERRALALKKKNPTQEFYIARVVAKALETDTPFVIAPVT